MLLLKFQQRIPALLLVVVLIIVAFVYRPGLQGNFIFDDFPNLEGLGTYGGVVDAETFNNFVFNGIASSIGRPVALATFVLDDNTWPSKAEWFKATNLKIHLLTGLLLCWASLHLMRLLGFKEVEASWIALLNCAIWLLHPYMVSTTLYVVQRMAQLAALFILCGITGYLYGRLLALRGQVKAGYLWMSLSLIVFTPLAVLSKENGILLAPLILIIEFCLPSALPKLLWQWRLLFLWLPAIVLSVGLLSRLELHHGGIWPNRPFTQWERILTEPRILWEYLYHLYVPRIEGRGLFQDGYTFSRSIMSPVATIVSIVGLAALVVAALFYRKKFPFACLSILFFLISHTIESTWLNLELYFEHRNYAASVFLFLPIAVFLVQRLPTIIDYRLACFCSILVLCLLAFLTWNRSNLWSNTERLQYYWAVSTPESVRAQNQIVNTLLNHGSSDKALENLEASVEKFKDSSFLTLNLLYIKIQLGRAQESDFLITGQRLIHQPFDAQGLNSMRAMVENLSREGSNETYVRYAIPLLDGIYANKIYGGNHIFKKLYFYCKARLYLRLKEYPAALENYQIAMKLYSETDAALSMVAEMGDQNRPKEALILLAQAEQVYKNQGTVALKRSRQLYDKEFARMKFNLEQSE